MQKRIDNIQALRGISILFIVLVHLIAMDIKFGRGDRIFPDFLFIGTFGVDLFFVISGFVLVAARREGFQRPFSVLHFFYNRLSRIYPLYWFYCAMILAVFLVLPEWIPALRENRTSIVASLLLLPQNVFPFLPVAWALVHVIYFYCVFTIFMLTSEKQMTNLLILWAFLVMIGNLSYKYGLFSQPTPIMKLITSPLTMEFIAGCVIAKLIKGGMKSFGGTVMIVGAALLITGNGLYYAADPGKSPRDWLRVAILGIPSILMVYGAVTMELSSKRLFPRWIRFIGDASYSIFLSHTIVLLPIGRLWAMFFSIPGKIDNILIIAAMAVVALCVGIGSYLTIERLLSSIFKRVGMVLFSFRQPTVQRGSPRI
jgi:peptidoglycan/LPS O-acetylase OafA/YrhL